MKKSTLLIILIIYIASIPLINLFGMSAKVYNKIVNVSTIECLNESDNKAAVTDREDKKIIKVPFTSAANEETLTGTMYQLKWRVYPDNASKKDVRFVYDTTNTKIKFYKDEKDRETGLVLFTEPTMLDIQIMSTDGTKRYTTITFVVRPDIVI